VREPDIEVQGIGDFCHLRALLQARAARAIVGYITVGQGVQYPRTVLRHLARLRQVPGAGAGGRGGSMGSNESPWKSMSSIRTAPDWCAMSARHWRTYKIRHPGHEHGHRQTRQHRHD